VARCFGRVFVNRKITEGVERIAFLARLHDEFLRKFVVGESRQTKHARRIRCRQITAELICEVVKERLCLILTESGHSPHDWCLPGEVSRTKFGRGLLRNYESRQELRRPSCRVEIDVAYILYILFGPAVRAVLNWIIPTNTSEPAAL